MLSVTLKTVRKLATVYTERKTRRVTPKHWNEETLRVLATSKGYRIMQLNLTSMVPDGDDNMNRLNATFFLNYQSHALNSMQTTYN